MKAYRDKKSRLVESVIVKAESVPADFALKKLLREVKTDPDTRREVSLAVFRYFRWLGWIRDIEPIGAQLEEARQLEERFDHEPESFSDQELAERAVPEWAHEVMDLPPAFLRELQRPPPLWIRAREGRSQELINELEGGAVPHPNVPNALEYAGDWDLFITPAFREGQFEIQDLSSQIVGRLCNAKPGETWWDACAGEGGKTLLLGDMMQNKGLIWATDRSQWRLDRLKTRASRAKLFNYRSKLWPEVEHLPVKAKFDGILVDAPCSGIGTWGRNPHARWSTTRKDVEELAIVQQQILNRAADSLKPGGRFIYSVCTLSRPETTDVASTFSQQHPDLEPIDLGNAPFGVVKEGGLWLWPQDLRANGMFIAGWRRKN